MERKKNVSEFSWASYYAQRTKVATWNHATTHEMGLQFILEAQSNFVAPMNKLYIIHEAWVWHSKTWIKLNFTFFFLLLGGTMAVH